MDRRAWQAIVHGVAESGVTEQLSTAPELLGFPGGARGEEPACQCRRCRFNPWVRKIPWRRAWQLAPVFLPGESPGQRTLVGYSPQGPTEWDTTEEIACTLPSSYYKPHFLGSGLGCFDQEKQGPCSNEIYLLIRESTNQSYPSPLKLMAQDVCLSPAIVSSFQTVGWRSRRKIFFRNPHSTVLTYHWLKAQSHGHTQLQGRLRKCNYIAE